MDIRSLVRPGILDLFRYEPGEDLPAHVKLSSNENPRSPHAGIVEAVARAMRTANRYPPSGVPKLTAALAKRHGVSSSEVIVGNGSNELIDLLVRSFAGPEHNVVYPRPSFIVYATIPAICGCEGRPVDCVDYRVDLEGMAEAIDANTRLVFLCNPNNPTSTYVTAGEVQRFFDRLPPHVLVVMDEAYIDYVEAGDYPDSLALRRETDRLIVLRTFSKFYAVAGLRVGYALAHPDVVDVLHRVRQPFNVNALAEAAALAAIEHTADLRPMADETIRERARVRETLLDLGFRCPPSQTNFVFADLPASELDLHDALRKHNIIVRRLGQFGASLNAYRITVGTPEENDLLISALHAVFGAATGDSNG